ncbi:MAG: glycosyltransferase family 2 protein, partial [Acidimicrobiales bacterium]
MEPQPSAPPVVAVVVTCDPGPWFEEALDSLAAQDYPNLSVLIIDSGSLEDPTQRVAAVLPDAYVRRLNRRLGYGRAVNAAIEVVEGASHFLLCHDDVALAPDAARLLVEEAYRSNAGIVSPKVMEWDRPGRLQAVGLGADKVGAVHNMVDPGELDQEQHDAVRDVFVAPGCACLVRSDLFSSLGGYDPDVEQFGE